MSTKSMHISLECGVSVFIVHLANDPTAITAVTWREIDAKRLECVAHDGPFPVRYTRGILDSTGLHFYGVEASS